ncbi:TPA: hypothetical protein HIQ38_000159 [Escherichia coli]|nr:hypothetical protein [Escherichia coli]HAH9177684.1 hypothetical protein [Escherichia coli]HAH9182242.1 hypothetical protein [Escherichia coli]HAH9204967.1 hypothetical protein [Escherichia coli]HAH9423499.1 hypothetical protein [Escherichia coli]
MRKLCNKHIQIRNSDMAWHIAANNLG